MGSKIFKVIYSKNGNLRIKVQFIGIEKGVIKYPREFVQITNTGMVSGIINVPYDCVKLFRAHAISRHKDVFNKIYCFGECEQVEEWVKVEGGILEVI